MYQSAIVIQRFYRARRMGKAREAADKMKNVQKEFQTFLKVSENQITFLIELNE